MKTRAEALIPGTTSGTTFTGDWTKQSVYIELTGGSDTGGSGLESATYSINGGTATTSAQTLSTEGKYTIVVTTKDNAGNSSTRTYIIRIDQTPPNVGELTMKYGSSTGNDYTSGVWTNQDIYIAVVNGTDTLSGHKSTTYTVKKDGEEYSTNQTVEQILTEEGIYTITVTTTDNVGYTTTSDEYVVKIDKTAPTVGSVSIKYGDETGDDYVLGEWTFQNIYLETVDGYDEEGGSGHKSTTLTILRNEEEYLIEELAPITLTQAGSYTVTVVTEDIAGNKSTTIEYKVNIDSADQNATIGLDKGTLNPIYKPEWEIAQDENGANKVYIDEDSGTLTIGLKGASYEYQNIDSNVTIDYASDVTSTLVVEDITVYIDGVEVTSTTNPKIELDTDTETQPEISTGEESGKEEITHTIVLSNLEEASRQAGIPYKELSGNITLKITGRGQDSSTYSENVLTDVYGNQNMMETDQNGTNADGTWIAITYGTEETDANTDGLMFADFIKPEFTYEYSESDIDYDNKKLTVVFSVVDKYLDSVSNLEAEDLTIFIDGEEPEWRTEGGTTGVTRTLTKKTLEADVTDETTNITYKADGSIEYNGSKIGERYELILSNLEQNPNDGYNYSGIVTIGIPEGIASDKSGNTSNAQTISVGLDIPGEVEYVSPSELFDADGTNEDGLHIGDFVEYDAGIWTQEEIDAIQTGLASSPVTANNSTSLPTENFQFGGFTAGSSRNENATPFSSDYDYVKNEGGEAISGWRVFDIEGDNVTLISAGNSEDYYHPTGTNYGYISEYILTGNVNSGWTDANTNTYQKRNWNDYVNVAQKAESATILSKSELDRWYSKYTDAGTNADSGDYTTFQKIYAEPYLSYQNMIDNQSVYWISAANLSAGLKCVDTYGRSVSGSVNNAFGVRVLVTLSSDALFTAEKTGTKTLTGGNMDSYGGNQTYNVWGIQSNDTIVDVVDPIWELGDVDLENGTIKLTAKDKYFSEVDIDEDDITIYVNGIASTVIVKDITSIEPTNIYDTVSGVENTLVGKEYTLQLSNLITEGGGYTGFEPTNKDTDGLVVDENGYAYYKTENAGTIALEIAAETITDQSGNKSVKQQFDIGTIDITKPEVYDIQKTQDAEANTETIIFNVTDRYYDPSDLVTLDEITLWIDDVQIDSLINNATLTSKEIWGEPEGATEAVILGHQYTLVISNIAETVRQTGKDYLEYSGTLKIEIAEDASKDTSGNTLNTDTTTITDFVDIVKPELQYKHSTSDIDSANKKYTMTFEITDKYYTSGELSLDDLTILMQNGQYETEQDENGEWQYKLDEDGNKIPIVYDLKNEPVTISLSSTEKTATFNKTIFNEDGTSSITNGTYTIGHTYTLTISGLTQLKTLADGTTWAEIKDGHTTQDYSGIITVAVAPDIVKDSGTDGVSPNGNVATTITSGVNIEGGTQSGTATEVDVVDPIWEIVSSLVDNQTATITLRGTDTYFDTSTLTADIIKLLVNGSEVTDGSITKTLDSTTNLTEERLVNGVNTTVQYGAEYTITISGLPTDVNQIKIQIPEGILVDSSGNESGFAEFFVYNVLKSTATETTATSAFLGESVDTTLYPEGVTEVTPIAREDIEKVIFVDDIENVELSGIQRLWDVSAQGDNSIVAWTTNTAAPYTVYIGSYGTIFANPNSSYLFSYIGYSENCTATEAITNLYMLNTGAVLNMECMFQYCGYNAMTSLDLGSNFDTNNVAIMSYMFNNTGYKAMTSLDLGDKFDTGNVEYMNNMFASCGYTVMTSLDLGNNFNTENVRVMGWMFFQCGYTAMTSINLGDNFDTSSVEHMDGMFHSCGYTAMEELDLGDQFNTSNVKYMQHMFQLCGLEKMTSLDLGDKFNTSNVTNMEYMFEHCGEKSMTSLNLGSLFDTSNVTNMQSMFASCGYTAMTSLDLGDKFDTSSVTNMKWMFASCGYTAMTSLDLGDKFNTSNVTNMYQMFVGCGAVAMISLDLGDKFDTSNVTDMNAMFRFCGYAAMTSLDLGDKFNISNVTNMYQMFLGCGYTAMKTLDLGPAFTKIPEGTITETYDDGNTVTYGAHDYFITSCGKEGELTIYAPESIYASQSAFKLNSTSTTTITPETIDFDTGATTERGTIIIPQYKPKWTVDQDENGANKVYIDTTNKTMTVTIKGSAYQASQVIDSNVTINYASDVTSTLAAEDITVYVDGVEVTSTTNPTIVVNEATSTTNAAGATEITHTIVLSNLEQAVRQAGKQYKEWSGNIAIKIGGRGEETSTYTANVLVDEYGNQNMMQTDEGQTAGTWINVKFEDTATDTNTDGIMFADFIKPEFTYVYHESDINYENKTLTVVFDAIDKYFANSTLAVTDLDILVDGVAPTWATAEEAAVDGNTKPVREFTSITDVTDSETGEVIGKQYTLLLSNLEQVDETGFGDGFTYSGVVTIAIPEGKVTDNSGNTNDATTITVGIDEQGEDLPSTDYTTPYLPTGYSYVEGDLNSGLVIADESGNEYVWVEVPKDTTVYSEETLALDLDSLSGDELTAAYSAIESDLHTYTSTYRNGTSFTDTWYSEAQHGFASSDDYNALKYKMLKSVFEYGGFYVGRYEAGTATARISKNDELTDAVIQPDVYPYNFVINAQAQSLASSFAENLEGYESSLMFGVQWDLVLKYMETKGASVAELNSDSTEWGNYYNNTYTTNASSKYSTNYGSTWTEGTYEKTSSSSILLTTGASSEFNKEGIYDIAGNIWEWTLDTYTSDSSAPCVVRGGVYDNNGVIPAACRGNGVSTDSNFYVGFRVTLYKDVDLSPDTDGQIVDVVDPIWELGDVDLENGTIKLIAKDKYFSEVDIDEDDITVYVNGSVSTAVVKDITSVEPTNIYDTVSGVENTLVGKEYTLQLSNLIPEGGGYTGFEPTNKDTDGLVVDENGYAYYKTDNGGNISIEIAADTIIDQSGNKNIKQLLDVGTIDATNPEVYEVQKTQDAEANTETIIFNVTDRNYDSSDLVTLDVDKDGDGVVDPEITLWIDDVQIDSLINNATLTSKEIWGIAEGETEAKILGHQYTLVISNIAETVKQTGKDYLEYSGILRIEIAEGAAKDIAGNTLNPDTTTITDFVDYLKPQMQQVTVTNPINTTDKTYTMSFTIIDKYLDATNMVTADELTVYIDGEEASSISKNLTSTPITATMNKTVDGVVTNGTYTIGHTYTLVLSDFEQSTKQTGKDFYEWSGTVTVEIATTAVEDTTGNTLDSTVANRTLTGEHVDFIKPLVEKVSSTSDVSAKTETIIFNIMDKYLDTSDVLEDTEITVYIDGEETSGISMSLTKVQDFTHTVNGDSTHVVGQQYKLVLSGFEQSTRNAKDYKDWSGTVSIEIAQTAVKDMSSNTLDSTNTKRTVVGDFVDFIKPDLKYTHSASDIDTTNKKYTMTFDITDKYYTSGQLELSDLTILMQNGQKDSSGNAIVYDLIELAENGEIDITSFNAVEETAIFKKTVDGSVEETATSHVIGHTYTLTITGLERLYVEEDLTTANYSGVITVAMASDMIKDSGPNGDGTNPNGNVATTITSGVSISAGVESGTATEVDVVDPIWESVSATAYAEGQTASITVRGTDTYFNVDDTDASTLTSDEIEIYINGTKNTSITPIISTATALTEERIINGVNTTGVQYGVEYTISLTGFAQDVNQVKIRILEDAITDDSGNGNKETDLIVYNVLKVAADSSTDSGYEDAETSAFLGESVGTTLYPEGVTEVTPIERQNIEKIIFVNSTSGSTATGVQRVWDVSAQGDKSIIAWTSNTTAPYTVYIGSNWEIFANQDSSYLFSKIGYSESCTATQTVENLDLLNTESVTNMSYMFYAFGKTAMTSLDLGEFYTSNVTNMSKMFTGCGRNAMTTFNLGTEFDTSKVTDMSEMFDTCGYTVMTTLNLGSKFDTSNVTDMDQMFARCGYTAMTSLDLGNKFDTSKVNNMTEMFNSCGYTAMTTLNLGSKFDTSNVTNMRGMFYCCGYTAMTTLNLGSKFDTSNVTDMSIMFQACGYTAMTTLNLGSKFDTSNVTNMGLMFNACGKNAMTSLDLGDKFYTTNVTNMYGMFMNCVSLTTLDLGPAFTKIPDGTITDSGEEVGAHDKMFENCGTSTLKIYAPEAIYANSKSFK